MADEKRIEREIDPDKDAEVINFAFENFGDGLSVGQQIALLRFIDAKVAIESKREVAAKLREVADTLIDKINGDADLANYIDKLSAEAAAGEE